MPCGQPKLSSTPSHSVSSTRARIFFQASSSQGTISETTSARSGHARLTSLISCRLISRSRSVMSSMLLKAIRRRSGPCMRAVARAGDVDDRRPRLAKRLPDDAAPAGAERALDIGLAVGRRRRGEPERVRRFDAEELRAKIDHDVLPQLRSAAIDRTRRLLAVLDRAHRQIEAADDAVAARPDAFEPRAPLVVDDELAVLQRRRLGAENARARPSGRSR